METPLESYYSFPKVELHRHLEGSLRASTLADISREQGLNYKDTAELRPLVQIFDQEPRTVENFLAKFGVLRQFYLTPEIIQRVTREAVEDAALDNVRYMELRFSPVALSRIRDFPLAEAMDWVIEAVHRASQEQGIGVNLIASVNRHESVDLAEQVIQLAVDRQAQGVVAVDLAGDEANFPADAFRQIFLNARQAGLYVCIHAGEWSGAANVAYAIEQIYVDRIGHGVRVVEDPAVVRLARATGTPFEVCITSNVQSGVVTSLENHPIRQMILEGLRVTINTDDPGISQITLSDEYQRAVKYVGLSKTQVADCIITAARVSFLDDEKRDELTRTLLEEISNLREAD
jgi:adenosine deaminase